MDLKPFAGIFLSENGQRLLQTLVQVSHDTFSPLLLSTQMEKEKVLSLLEGIPSWEKERMVLVSEKATVAHPDIETRIRRCFVEYCKEMHSHSQMRLLVNYPPTFLFLHLFLVKLTSSSLFSPSFLSLPLLDRQMICMAACRDSLFSLSTDERYCRLVPRPASTVSLGDLPKERAPPSEIAPSDSISNVNVPSTFSSSRRSQQQGNSSSKERREWMESTVEERTDEEGTTPPSSLVRARPSAPCFFDEEGETTAFPAPHPSSPLPSTLPHPQPDKSIPVLDPNPAPPPSSSSPPPSQSQPLPSTEDDERREREESRRRELERWERRLKEKEDELERVEQRTRFLTVADRDDEPSGGSRSGSVVSSSSKATELSRMVTPQQPSPKQAKREETTQSFLSQVPG